MKCWRCEQEINDGTRECIYCHADQRRSVPTSDVGQALRQLYDHYGAEAVLKNNVLLVNGLGDVVTDTLDMNVKKIKNQLKIGMDAGLGRLYKEQIGIGKPDAQFYSRVKILLTEDAGLSEKSADEIITYFDEMIGWCGSVQSSAPQRGNDQEKEAAYQNALWKIDAKNRSDMEEVLRILQGLSGYKDADQLAKKCRDRIAKLKKEEIYQQVLREINSGKGKSSYERALRLLEQIPGYRDADRLIRACQSTIKGYEDESKGKKQENKKKIGIILVFVLLGAISILFLNNFREIQHQNQTATAFVSANQTEWTHITETANAPTNTPTRVPTETPTATPRPSSTPTRISTKTPTATPRPSSTPTIRPTRTVISQYDYESRFNSVTLGSPISENDFILYDQSENKYISYLNGLTYSQSRGRRTARGIEIGTSQSSVKYAYGQPNNTYYVTSDTFPIRISSGSSWVWDSLNNLCWEYRYYIDGEKVSLYFVFNRNQSVMGIGIWRRNLSAP